MAIWGALVVVGCGGGDAEEPAECDPEDRSGTYLISYDLRSGDCGELPETVGRLSADDLRPECELSAPDVWSDNGCTFERATYCEIDGVAVDSIGTTTANNDASRITGILTVSSGSCVGTYDMTAERQ